MPVLAGVILYQAYLGASLGSYRVISKSARSQKHQKYRIEIDLQGSVKIYIFVMCIRIKCLVEIQYCQEEILYY